MKALREHCSIQEAEQLASLCRSRGIVTFISNKQTNITGSYTTGANTVGLWAVLKNQYEDAEALLRNPEHDVTTGLSDDELVAFEKKAANFKVASMGGLYHVLGFMVGFAVVVGAVVYLVHASLN